MLSKSIKCKMYSSSSSNLLYLSVDFSKKNSETVKTKYSSICILSTLLSHIIACRTLKELGRKFVLNGYSDRWTLELLPEP